MREQRCPYCGAALTLKSGLSMFFCKYCGGKIHVDERSGGTIELQKMEHEETMKQLENDHDFRKMDHIEKVQAEENSQERFRLKQKSKGGFRKGCLTVLLIIVAGILILAAIVEFGATYRSNSLSSYKQEEAKKFAAHEKEVQRLTNIEKEVLLEIDRGDYTKALVKANTIHYNAPEYIGTWGEAKKWDERREEIIKSIYQVSGIATPTPVPTAAAFYPNDSSIKTTWPRCEIAKMIPVPVSDNTKISWENEKGFYVEVEGYSDKQFATYIDACWDRGFTQNYDKSSSHFRADHQDGYHLSLSYRGNTMSVKLEKKTDE